MSIRAKNIFAELREHAPFTIIGAVLGIAFMLVFKNTSETFKHGLFLTFHPLHVVLSAMVTTALFSRYTTKKFVAMLLVGYFGSIGIATLSDIVIPYFGSKVLKLNIPSHAEFHEHQHEHAAHDHELCEAHDHEENAHYGEKMHLAFLEDWHIVTPSAFLGIGLAFVIPKTKFPHAGHVLVSTWASSAYMLSTFQQEISMGGLLGAFITLFLAVWLPCCVSDIVFPLLFVGKHAHADCCPHLFGKKKEPENDRIG